MIELPKEKIKAVSKSPKKLLIYSPPKTGKTTVASMLENNLLMDFEGGSHFVDALKVEIPNLNVLQEYVVAIKSAGKPYRYGTIDTTTKLEEMVLPLALQMYKNTPMGVNFKGDNVLTLPNGGGYLYLREAFTKITDTIDSLFERTIYFGHLKDKMLEKAGKEVSAKDIDLTGKIRNIACANADAIGYLYRSGKQTILSFVTTQDVICGARPEHLRNQEIVVLEEIDGKLVSHWDRIYID